MMANNLYLAQTVWVFVNIWKKVATKIENL